MSPGAAHNGVPGRRYYNPVQNVADALMFILVNGSPETTDRPVRFNLPGGEEVDNLQMAQRVAAILGKPLSYRIVDAESVRPGYDQFYPRTEGRLSTLGWVPPFDLTDELKRIVEKLADAPH